MAFFIGYTEYIYNQNEGRIMALAWSDSRELAISLAELYPEQDPAQIRFTDLRRMIIELDDFNDDPNHCGERVLEAVMMAWIDEY